MKALIEKRNQILEEMNSLVNQAEEETRALAQEEMDRYEELKGQIADIDRTIQAGAEARAMEFAKSPEDAAGGSSAEVEERAFEGFLRGMLESRANMTQDANGAVIPSSIANKIIKKVQDICPIYAAASKYNVKGNFSIPYYDEGTDKITVEYATEFTDPTAHAGQFKSIELKGFLARAFSLISKSLVNHSDFDIVGFVVNDMAESISRWIEKELLNGTDSKIEGLKGVTQKVTAAAANVLTADELIDTQELVPDVFQGNAFWVMNKATRTAIRKLKDNDGNYLLNKDVSARWGYTLLGKDVYTSANMPGLGTGKTAVYYGDMSGLAVKISEQVNVEVLREKYAEQHAIGVVGFVEIDSKVENAQKIGKLVMGG